MFLGILSEWQPPPSFVSRFLRALTTPRVRAGYAQEGQKYTPGNNLSLVDIIEMDLFSTSVPKYYISVAAPVQPGIAIPASRVEQEGPKCCPGTTRS